MILMEKTILKEEFHREGICEYAEKLCELFRPYNQQGILDGDPGHDFGYGGLLRA